MNPQFLPTLRELIAFARNIRRAGLAGVDPEEYAKQHLIDPLLAVLGYATGDIRKEFHILGDQCDYLLQRRRPLLFIEAKKLSQETKKGGEKDLFEQHREQVLRYLRNYRVSPEQVKMEQPVTWLLLTNFAQFHFIRVNEEKPTFSFRLDELEKRAAELWELLAPEHLEAGRIDELYDQEQKANLDRRFLADLKQWRLILANGFALQNQSATLPDLTIASQQLLDRFLFCRMLETHGLIEYNKLARAFVNYDEIVGYPAPETFASFLRRYLFVAIRTDFNTELFVQPQLCDTLEIDNDFVATVLGHTALPGDVAQTCGIAQGQGELLIFRHLYSYDFSRMSHDIMGSVYERFLAHKLEEKGRRIVIEETDELRKKEGIYYTPRYIVDYLIAHTLGEKTAPIVGAALALLAEKKYGEAYAKIRELSALKVLDPSMGSGSFLLRAFDHLLGAYESYNTACREHKRAGNGDGHLFGEGHTIAEELHHPALLVTGENIFGVDLDPQAVELARLNIWMRLMIAERDLMREKLRTRQPSSRPLSLLPSLSNNLKRGNSLIADAAVAGDAAFDWPSEFPAIMERGGFDVVVGNPPYRMLQPHNTDKATLDYLRAHYPEVEFKIDLFQLFLQRPESLLKNNGYFGYIVPTTLLNNVYAERLRRWLTEHYCIDFIAVALDKVFADADVHTSVFVFHKAKSAKHLIQTTTKLGLQPFDETTAYSHVQQSRFSKFPSGVWNILVNETNAGLIARLLNDFPPLENSAEVNRGLITGDREKFFSTKQTDETPFPILDGGDVHRYAVDAPSFYISMDRPDSAGGSWDRDMHLASHKIVIRQIAQGAIACSLNEPHAVSGNIFTIRGKNAEQESYLLGIINSKLIDFFWKIMFADFKKSFPQVTIQSLAQLPIKVFPDDEAPLVVARLINQTNKISDLCQKRQRFAPLLAKKIQHEHRTPCSLAHYLQKDFADVVKAEKLIDDVMRKGFLHGIVIEADNGFLLFSARVSDTKKGEPETLPVLRLDINHLALRQFIYAAWRQFLAENARRKMWTAGSQPEEIYRRLVNTEEPLVFFHPEAGDNLRAITTLLAAVADEAGVADLAALETEIRETDKEIDRLVYELYELTPEEIALVEGAMAGG